MEYDEIHMIMSYTLSYYPKEYKVIKESKIGGPVKITIMKHLLGSKFMDLYYERGEIFNRGEKYRIDWTMFWLLWYKVSDNAILNINNKEIEVLYMHVLNKLKDKLNRLDIYEFIDQIKIGEILINIDGNILGGIAAAIKYKILVNYGRRWTSGWWECIIDDILQSYVNIKFNNIRKINHRDKDTMYENIRTDVHNRV